MTKHCKTDEALTSICFRTCTIRAEMLISDNNPLFLHFFQKAAGERSKKQDYEFWQDE